MATATDPSPSPDFVLSEALRHQAMGFRILSTWSAKPDGTCKCVKGKDCPDPAKHPIPPTGFKAASDDPVAIHTMLAAGSDPNYGLVWPKGSNVVFILDADGPTWAEHLRELSHELGPLPLTKVTTTPSGGRHIFYRWPSIVDLPPKLGQLFGFVTRWPESGYVIGPGSADGRGMWVDSSKVDEIATLPKEWALAAVAEASPRSVGTRDGAGPLITVHEGGGYVLPESVPEGRRYDAVRDYIAHLYNRGLSTEERASMVRSVLVPRFAVAHTEAAVTNYIAKVERDMVERLGPPASAAVAREAPTRVPEDFVLSDLVLNIEEYRKTVPDKVEWVSPLAFLTGTTILAGPAKAGKSSLLANLLRARETGDEFLGMKVPVGPTLLISEEGGLAVLRKTVDLHKLDLFDRRMFARAGLTSWEQALDIIMRWVDAGNDKALVVIDTLARWAKLKDENDSSEGTVKLDLLETVSAETEAAVIVTHHLRKGGGEHGEGIRGGGALLATPSHVVEFNRVDPRSDDRYIDMSGRLVFPSRQRLAFDRATFSYSLIEDDFIADPDRLSELPTRGSGDKGFTSVELASMWDISRAAATNKANTLVARGVLAKELVKDPGARASHNVYWRVELLTVGPAKGSVADEMTTIFGGGD